MTEELESSRALVERARAGDAEALDRLLIAHLPKLRAFVRLEAGAALRAKESVSDLVQSACREVLEDLGEFDYSDEAGFRRWLILSARRKLADRGRSLRRARRDIDREEPARSGYADPLLAACYGTMLSPSRAAIAAEDVERLEAAFDTLSEAEREVILARAFLGQGVAEIADDRDEGTETVKKRLARARARLWIAFRGLDA